MTRLPRVHAIVLPFGDHVAAMPPLRGLSQELSRLEIDDADLGALILESRLLRVALVYPAEVAPATHRIRNDDVSVLVRTVPVGEGPAGFADLDRRAAPRQ